MAHINTTIPKHSYVHLCKCQTDVLVWFLCSGIISSALAWFLCSGIISSALTWFLCSGIISSALAGFCAQVLFQVHVAVEDCTNSHSNVELYDHL